MQTKLDDQKDFAMMFAGIGSDYGKVINKLGEKELCKIRKLSQLVKDILFSDSGDEENSLTDWLSIYICDYVIYHLYIERGIVPRYFIGYSMGLITAMACGNAISFQDGALLLHQIYNQKFQEEEGMVTIIGLEREQLEEMIVKCECQNSTFIACENNSYCFVLSGMKKSNQKVTNLAVLEGALNTYQIESKFAFHTPLYQIPERDLSIHVNKIQVSASSVPIVSCIDQRIIGGAVDLKEELIRNMYSKMMWEKSIRRLSQSGIKNYIEVGLGKSLTKISKLINDTNHFYTFGDLDIVYRRG